jgi:hypothetical protein
MSFEREAQRQQMMLRALAGVPAATPALHGWLRDAAPRAQRGLAAYRANAGASAERALAAAFPTVAALVGDVSFPAMARAFWHASPPLRGDLGEWGDALPAFIEDSEQLAGEPYLADSARLDWAVHAASRAADQPAEPEQLEALAHAEPAELQLVLRAGTALRSSRWPIASIHAAHQSDGAGRFEPVREALAAGRGEHALVWREGWRVRVAAVSEADAAFTRSLLGGTRLGTALELAELEFDFTAWLTHTLQRGVLARVVVAPAADFHRSDS